MSLNGELFLKKSTFPVSARHLYDYHARPGALERLIPPWDKVTLLERSGGLGRGGRTILKLHFGPFTTHFEAHHLSAIEGLMFEDIQQKGPFAYWHHTHSFEDTENGGTLTDKIQYRLPFQRLLPPPVKRHIRSNLDKTFNYRHRILLQDLKRHQQYSSKPLSILISGASGVLGQELTPFLKVGGHSVWTLVRRAPQAEKQEIFWNPAKREIDRDSIPEIDAVIHLAGEYIGLGRWNHEKKRRVIESRERGTRLLAKTMAELKKPPRVFLSSSAVGYYGDCGSDTVSEEYPAGDGFMAEVCRVWEEATKPALDAGIRTVTLRMGVALGARGGALQKLLQIGSLGFPRSFGNGKQFTSWISIDDMLGAILHCLCCEKISGPVNIAAPNPVTNEELLYTLSRLKNKPILPRVPVSYLKLFYGEMAKEIALSGCRVSIEKLKHSGFIFEHQTLNEAISSQLGIENK